MSEILKPRFGNETLTFDQFYSAYPRKVAKKDAMKAWDKLTQDQQKAAVEALPRHVRYWQGCETEKAFIPHPATWLNGWRFEDEIEEVKPKVRVDLKGSISDARPGESMEDYLRRVAG